MTPAEQKVEDERKAREETLARATRIEQKFLVIAAVVGGVLAMLLFVDLVALLAALPHFIVKFW